MIYHLAYRSDWDRAQRAGDYRQSTKGRTLEQEGFIHACATPAQLERVANLFYRGDSGLLVLVIDEGKVGPEIRYERVPGVEGPFPHIYGSLVPDAVIDAIPLEPDSDGEFSFPGAGA